MRGLFIPLSLFIVFMGCNQSSEKAEETQDHTVSVTTEKSREITYNPEKTYSGNTSPYKEANLGTTLPGKVEKIHHDEGTYVSEGTLLVELSAELYAQALAEKNSLEKDYNRVQRLREKGSVTQQKLDHIKAKYKAAKAKARMMKENCEVRAPFSGVIVEYLVKEGENFMFSPGLKPGYSHTSGIVRFMQLSRLKIKIDVNEQDLNDIKKGQTAQIQFDAFPDTTFKGQVTHIAPILSTATHSAKVEVTVNNRQGKLKPGMFATVDIRMPERKDVFIPLNAIFRQTGTGNHYVFIVNDEKQAIRKGVTQLYTKDKQVAVKGIKKNRDVVVHGKNKLKSGDQVIVENQ